MDNEKFVELVNKIFISGVAYGMAFQIKEDIKDYKIVDEETGKMLFDRNTIYELAISLYPEAFIPSSLKDK